MRRACFSAYYWVHVLHNWGFLGVIVVLMVIYRPWDLGKNMPVPVLENMQNMEFEKSTTIFFFLVGVLRGGGGLLDLVYFEVFGRSNRSHVRVDQ